MQVPEDSIRPTRASREESGEQRTTGEVIASGGDGFGTDREASPRRKQCAKALY